MEVIPKLNKRLDIPLYVQLYNYFRQEIERSEFKAGLHLPSIRYLADELKISNTTVQMAYQQLAAEGYIDSKPRRGYFVAESEGNSPKTTMLSVNKLPTSEPQLPCLNIARYDFFMSTIDTEHFPLKAWRKCENRMLRTESQNSLGYGDTQGEYRLRQSLAHYLRRSRGVICTAEQIVIAAGTQAVLDILYHLIDWKYYRLAMEDPGYQGVRRSLQGGPIRLIPVSIDHDGLSISELSRINADAVYITPSHQYPLGMVMPINRRMNLLSWAEKMNHWIIEDDYDGEFRYLGKPIPSLKSIDEHSKVIYIGTFSKSLMPAIRIGYMVLPPALLQIYQHLEWRQTASRLHQLTLASFIETGQWERHIRRMRTLYRKKQQLLLETIKTVMGHHIQVSGQHTGLHIVLRVASRCSAADLIDEAQKNGIKVYCPNYLSVPEEGKGVIILLGFGGLSSSEIRAGIRLLHHAWTPCYL